MTTDAAREEFERCPFCGSNAQSVYKDTSDPRYKPVYSVRCVCSAEVGFEYDRGKVIAAWNRRATPDRAPAPEAERDAERWRFANAHHVQFYGPKGWWVMYNDNGAEIARGKADTYQDAIDAAIAAQGDEGVKS